MNAKLNTLTKSLLVAGVIGVVSAPVAAKKYRDYREYNNSAYDYAKVVNVSPVVETYQVNHPVGMSVYKNERITLIAATTLEPPRFWVVSSVR